MATKVGLQKPSVYAVFRVQAVLDISTRAQPGYPLGGLKARLQKS